MKEKTKLISGKDVIAEEHEKYIKPRREYAKVDAGDPEKDAVGLGLSGGGIRSATFSLGVLQAMELYGFLKRVDYLSTVSGGGYIGSALTWFMSFHKTNFPFPPDRFYVNKEKYRAAQQANTLGTLREHASYLTPGQGLNVWSLVAFILGGTLINLLVIIPFFVVIVVTLSLPHTIDLTNSKLLSSVQGAYFALSGPSKSQASEKSIILLSTSPAQDSSHLMLPVGFSLLLIIGVASLALFIISFLFYALVSSTPRFQHRRVRDWAHVWQGQLLSSSVVLLAIGAIPLLDLYIEGHFKALDTKLHSSFSIAGIFSLIGGLTSWGKKIQNQEYHKGYRRVLIDIGLALIIYSVLLWICSWVRTHDGFMRIDSPETYLLFFFTGLSILISLCANINHVSIHRYYRDRLRQAFMPKVPEGMKNICPLDTRCLLKDIPQTSAPYQIINTTMMVWGSSNPKLQLRGGDNFIFTPLYCGYGGVSSSGNTGYVPTSDYLNGSMDLATAFSISGAAVDPNTNETRSMPLSFLMSLFNLRIGYWAYNPKKWTHKAAKHWARPYWLVYALRQMLGMKLNEDHSHVYLTDGGHFENLGLYELIRRKCRYIILVDADEDGERKFEDLANAMRKVRVDFGVRITINTQNLVPDPNLDRLGLKGLSRSSWVLGDISYLHSSEKGKLLYIKASVIPDLSEELYAYLRVHSTFPHQSTGDQFFNEGQFEAYRELGYQVGKQIFDHSRDKTHRKYKDKTLDDFFKSLSRPQQEKTWDAATISD